MFRTSLILATLLPVLCVPTPAASQTAGPGDSGLRHDLQLLSDRGAINVPLTTWPLSWEDVHFALGPVNVTALDDASLAAFARLRERAARGTNSREAKVVTTASAAVNPLNIRTFEDTVRDEGQLAIAVAGRGRRFAGNLNFSIIANPDDGDRVRLDGTAVSAVVGNWRVSAGWQERWWGPGNAGSLILSNNARPFPALSLQRLRSEPFETRWLAWLGPWTFAAFAGQLTDDRIVDDALLIGARLTFKPLPPLEIGLSRTAQFCGAGRPCSASTVVDVLLGRDNRGVNVSAEDEPGNQLAGFDVRWLLPSRWRLAAYVQWIAEDSRQGGPEIGSWLRLAGLEHWGKFGALQHRSFLEIAETVCREGGLGFSNAKPGCAYEHSIYRSGYRYRGRSLGYGADGDGLVYSAGSTLVQSAGHRWTVMARYAEINRFGSLSVTHTLSPTAAERGDLLVTHERPVTGGAITIGIGWTVQRDTAADNRRSDPVAFVAWRSGLKD